jgi:N-methylhydantoinase A
VYGRAPHGLPLEILNWHLTAELPGFVFNLAEETCQDGHVDAAIKGEREIFFNRPHPGYRSCPVYDRYRLEPGATFPSPCVIEEREATVVVPPNCQVTIDGYRNLVITLEMDGETP